MKPRDISGSVDADLRTSVAAMRRAAASARETAIRTDTGIVLAENGNPIRISAAQLRASMNGAHERKKAPRKGD